MLAAQGAYADVTGYHYASSSPAALEATPAGMTTLVVSWVRRRVGPSGASFQVHCVLVAGFISAAPIPH